MYATHYVSGCSRCGYTLLQATEGVGYTLRVRCGPHQLGARRQLHQWIRKLPVVQEGDEVGVRVPPGTGVVAYGQQVLLGALLHRTRRGGPLPQPGPSSTPDHPGRLLSNGVGDTVKGHLCTFWESEG